MHIAQLSVVNYQTMHYLRLIRWKNLLIIFFTQLFVWTCVIRPIQHFAHAEFLLHFANFLLLSFSTILIAGAGYIINDYFDIRIDIINKPEKMVLEKTIPRRMGIIMHTVMNVVALLLAAIVARHYSWLLLQLFCTLLLWFYSTHFKRQFVIGNIVVALLTALTIIALIVYEPAMHFYLMQPLFISGSEAPLLNPVWVLMVYAYFAFVLTWMREIVKDMEDFQGDEAEGCITMPIKWGLKKATAFTIVLGIFALAPLIIAGIKLLIKRDWLFGGYIVLALIFPIVAWMLFLPKAAASTHYAKASRYLKLIMISGIGSLIIYYFEANG